MKYLAFLCLLLSACATAPTKTPVPSVAPVRDSLVVLADQIEAAGDSNTQASLHIKTAIELADELEILLNKIEEENET